MYRDDVDRSDCLYYEDPREATSWKSIVVTTDFQLCEATGGLTYTIQHTDSEETENAKAGTAINPDSLLEVGPCAT